MRLVKKWSSKWLVDDIAKLRGKNFKEVVFDEISGDALCRVTIPAGHQLDALVYMSNQCPILPSGYDPDSQVVNLFPRLVETIEPNTARHREVCKQRASHINKVLGGWLEQLGGTQYRYTCLCPALNCSNRVEFYSFKEPTEITYDETPKCEACCRG